MDNKSYAISIGMPVFNGAKFISYAIESLLAQTISDFELIISDNASTDSTEKICRHYAENDSRIRYIRQPINLGAIENFQIVLNESTSPYFMWAAADDIWDSKWIETLIPISKKNGCLSFGSIQIIDELGGFVHHAANRRRFTFAGSVFFRRLNYYLQPEFLGKANPIYGIYPRHYISKILFDKLKIGVNGDIYFLYEILKYIPIQSSMSVKLYKRVHDSCEGGGVIFSSERNNKILSTLVTVKREFKSQYKKLIEFNNCSLLIECFSHLFFFPYMVFLNFFHILRHRNLSKSELTKSDM
jgi:glycosyltransferase involved in cell wall biosynthesis